MSGRLHLTGCHLLEYREIALSYGKERGTYSVQLNAVTNDNQEGALPRAEDVIPECYAAFAPSSIRRFWATPETGLADFRLTARGPNPVRLADRD